MKRGICLLLISSMLFFTACTAQLEQKEILPAAVPAEKKTEILPVSIPQTEPVTEELPPPAVCCIDNITPLNQFPHFPTGCEATAAVTVLQYWGMEMEIGDFVDLYLPLGAPFYMKGGRLYGPDPYQCFVGHPRNATSFGCMAPAIRTALNEAVGTEMEVCDLSGMELEEMHGYIAKDIPVILWVTMYMTDTGEGASWYLPSGELYTWQTNEHCMVLVGYDTESYTLLDPMVGKAVTYPKELVALRYSQLGKQAIAVKR